MKKKVAERKDMYLRNQYEAGAIDADEFLRKLFTTKEADRTRINIEKKNKRFHKTMQEA